MGLLLAVLPGFVDLYLGFSPLWAGVAVSSQYLATLVTRPTAGRMTDVIGPRATVLLGQLVLLLSGLCLLAAASLQAKAMACLVVLLMSRAILGCGESCVATGAITWGLGRVAPEYAAQVISWGGIASYGAMAAVAPLGIWLETRYGLWSIVRGGSPQNDGGSESRVCTRGVHGISRFRDGHHRPDRRIYCWEVRLFGDFPLWLRSGGLRVSDYSSPLSLGP